MRLSLRHAILLALALAAGALASYLVPKPLPELSRAEFLDEVRAGRVDRVEIEDQDVILGESSVRGRFRSPFRQGEDGGLIDELRALGIEVRLTKSSPGLI
jgi:hypothetical protein